MILAVYFLAMGVKGLQLAGGQVWLPDLFNGLALIIAVTAAALSGGASILGGILRRGRLARFRETGDSDNAPRARWREPSPDSGVLTVDNYGPVAPARHLGSLRVHGRAQRSGLECLQGGGRGFETLSAHRTPCFPDLSPFVGDWSRHRSRCSPFARVGVGTARSLAARRSCQSGIIRWISWR